MHFDQLDVRRFEYLSVYHVEQVTSQAIEEFVHWLYIMSLELFFIIILIRIKAS
jgi:hypothetical protein